LATVSKLSILSSYLLAGKTSTANQNLVATMNNLFYLGERGTSEGPLARLLSIGVRNEVPVTGTEFRVRANSR